MGAFGDKLRQQREQRGISLDAISNATKIGTRMLRAIEDEHFDQLPGGVFNKGFVRAYARQVGLNEEEAIAGYLAALRESQVHAQTILPYFRTPTGKSAANAEEEDRRNPVRDEDFRGDDFHGTDLRGNDLRGNSPGPATFPSGALYEKDLAAESTASDRRIEARRKDTRRQQDREVRPQEAHPGADRPGEALDEVVPAPPLSFLNLNAAPSPHLTPHHDPEPMAAAASLPAENSTRRVPWEKLAAALLLITLSLAFWTLHRRSRSAAASQPAVSHQSPVPAAALASATTGPSAPAASLTVHSPKTAASTAISAATSPDPHANLPVAKPHALPAADKSPPTFTLLIRATQTSWVSITADGQPAAKETLIAPANTSVRAAHEIVVRTGNAAGISFLLNGKEIPAPGNPGEVRTYTFDATGLLTSASAPALNTAR